MPSFLISFSITSPQIETLKENKTYSPIIELSEALNSDSTLPPFWRAEAGSKTLISVYLDRERPLSEPKWVKTGDVQDWLKDMFGGRFWVAGEAVGWENLLVLLVFCYSILIV